jgi:hypothetical protein
VSRPGRRVLHAIAALSTAGVFGAGRLPPARRFLCFLGRLARESLYHRRAPSPPASAASDVAVDVVRGPGAATRDASVVGRWRDAAGTDRASRPRCVEAVGLDGLAQPASATARRAARARAFRMAGP